MNEWFKKLFTNIKNKWQSWKAFQKAIAIGLVVLVIVVIILAASLSSRKTTVRLFDFPVSDEKEANDIILRLNQDNVWAERDSQNYIIVENTDIAKKYRSQLVAEGLEPSKIDAYHLFDVTKWTRNDFDDDVNWKRSMEAALKQHLENLDGIRQADVMLTLPKESIFAQNQKPVQASVTLFAQPGRDVLTDKKQIQGIQHLIKTSVEGLTDENITIVDGTTHLMINDFEGMAEADRISNTEKEQKLKLKLDAEYSSRVYEALKPIYKDRIQNANADVIFNMDERSYTAKEYSGITIVPDNPSTPYDDSRVVDSLVISEETSDKKFTGTGYNPEGPAGVEGQNPPVYSDMSNVIGETTESGVKRNYALNEKNIVATEKPSISRITTSVGILSYWTIDRDEKGNFKINDENSDFVRTEHQISEEDRQQIIRLVQGAIGYDRNRNDSVVVEAIHYEPYDDWKIEFDKFIKAQQRKKTILFSIIGVAVVLVAFILFRLISREIERRRRLREEELLRKQQAEREQALWDAKNDGIEVTMSVEERKRAELQENAVAMAKEHPEDVAMLIRTWLMEE